MTSHPNWQTKHGKTITDRLGPQAIDRDGKPHTRRAQTGAQDVITKILLSHEKHVKLKKNEPSQDQWKKVRGRPTLANDERKKQDPRRNLERHAVDGHLS